MVNVFQGYSLSFTDFDNFLICCRQHDSEQLFLIYVAVVSVGSSFRDVRRILHINTLVLYTATTH